MGRCYRTSARTGKWRTDISRQRGRRMRPGVRRHSGMVGLQDLIRGIVDRFALAGYNAIAARSLRRRRRAVS